jgi:hypothetical protein
VETDDDALNRAPQPEPTPLPIKQVAVQPKKKVEAPPKRAPEHDYDPSLAEIEISQVKAQDEARVRDSVIAFIEQIQANKGLRRAWENPLKVPGQSPQVNRSCMRAKCPPRRRQSLPRNRRKPGHIVGRAGDT